MTQNERAGWVLKSTSGLVAAALALGIAAPSASADAVADFFRDKTVTIYAAAGGGGSYGVYNRVIAEHLGRHIPGNPSVVAQFMAGAGGAKCANFVYNAAPRDGTALGLLLKYVAVEQAIGRSSVKYDVRKFNWLISAAPINSVVALWHTAPATTLEGLKETEVVMGSTGKSSETYITPTLMNAFLGTKFKVVTGYKGSGALHLAMERGEIDGRAASYSSLTSTRPQWLTEHKVVIIAHSGLYRDPRFPDVPTVAELASDEDAKAVFEFVGTGSTLGRIFVAPPGVPEPRVAALRAAFEALLSDPQFLAEAKKRKINVDPRPATEVEAIIARTIDAPEPVIEKTRKIMK